MLLSPTRVHQDLSACLASSSSSSNGLAPASGPHTALLIAPQGQVFSWASNFHSADGDEGEQDGVVRANGHDTEDGDDADGEEEEPWLEDPERLRLLSGLASQWEEDASPRVECELGRLLLRQISLAKPETPPPDAQIPTLRSVLPLSFILVLNATSTVPWSALISAADTFEKRWKSSS